MRRHLSYRYALLISLIILGSGFYIYNLIPNNNIFQYTFISSPGSVTADHPLTTSDSTGGSTLPDQSGSQETPAPSETPLETEALLIIRGSTVSIGESKDSIIKKFGAPGRIDETEYDFDYYIYNNDYNRLLFIAISGDYVVGYYSDSVDFDYQGVCPGSDIKKVRDVLKKPFTMAEILSLENKNYTVQVLMDQLDTQKVTGIYVMSNTVQIDEYTDAVARNIELMVYDLTNSIRKRNQVPILSWSSSAAMASRKHSLDMAVNGFFGHTNLKREAPGDRLRAQGIFLKKNSENIIAGFGTAILSNHKWFNSKTQRDNMLNSTYRYLGVGFAYLSDSRYQTYITQNFYR